MALFSDTNNYMLGFFLHLALCLTALAAERASPEPQQILKPFEYKGGSIPVAFFDADSTLRVSRGQYFSPWGSSEVLVLPGVAEKIEELSRQGYFVAIVSNQHNMIKRTSTDMVKDAMRETIRGAEARGGVIHYFDYSVSLDEAKPNTAMADRLEKKLQDLFGSEARIDRARSFMVGDAAYRMPEGSYPGDIRPNGIMGKDHGNFDRLFAEKYGIKFHEPQDFFQWNKDGVERLDRPADVELYLKRKSERENRGRSCENNFGLLAPANSSL